MRIMTDIASQKGVDADPVQSEFVDHPRRNGGGLRGASHVDDDEFEDEFDEDDFDDDFDDDFEDEEDDGYDDDLGDVDDLDDDDFVDD